MKKAMLVVMFVLAVGGLVMAQNWSSPVDVLGAHNNNGPRLRGLACSAQRRIWRWPNRKIRNRYW